MLQLFVLSVGGSSLHPSLTDLLLDDLKVKGQLLYLLLQSISFRLERLRLGGEEGQRGRGKGGGEKGGGEGRERKKGGER